MKNVYEQTEMGWKKVFTAQSFEHACEIARALRFSTGRNFCVNN